MEAQFSSRLPRAATAITMLVTGTLERKVGLETTASCLHCTCTSIIRFDDYCARVPPSRLAPGTIEHAVRTPQEMLSGLCESYGSIISLAVYVGVLTGDADAETRIASSVAAVKSEFDRYPCHRQTLRRKHSLESCGSAACLHTSPLRACLLRFEAHPDGCAGWRLPAPASSTSWSCLSVYRTRCTA